MCLVIGTSNRPSNTLIFSHIYKPTYPLSYDQSMCHMLFIDMDNEHMVCLCDDAFYNLLKLYYLAYRSQLQRQITILNTIQKDDCIVFND